MIRLYSNEVVRDQVLEKTEEQAGVSSASPEAPVDSATTKETPVDSATNEETPVDSAATKAPPSVSPSVEEERSASLAEVSIFKV